MMFLLGRHAMFGHAPPTYLRSMTMTRCPFCAEVQAISFPPAPLPRTTRSYSSGREEDLLIANGVFNLDLNDFNLATVPAHRPLINQPELEARGGIREVFTAFMETFF